MDLIKITNINSLVISGGGMKGYLYIGAIKLLFEQNIIKKIKYFYGTSFGGIVATCLNLDWSIDELLKFAIEFPVSEIIEYDFDNIINNGGLVSQLNYETLYKKMISFKNFDENITFKELYDQTKKELHIITYSFKQAKSIDLNYMTYPNCKIWEGLYMTSALPLLIPPYKFEDDIFVDGGIVENFPIDRVSVENKYCTIGISTNNYKININDTLKIFQDKLLHNFIPYIIDIFQVISMKEMNTPRNNTIMLNFDETNKNSTIENLKSFDFTIDSTIKKQLIDSGYKQANDQFINIINYLFSTQLKNNKEKIKYAI